MACVFWQSNRVSFSCGTCVCVFVLKPDSATCWLLFKPIGVSSLEPSVCDVTQEHAAHTSLAHSLPGVSYIHETINFRNFIFGSNWAFFVIKTLLIILCYFDKYHSTKWWTYWCTMVVTRYLHTHKKFFFFFDSAV